MKKLVLTACIMVTFGSIQAQTAYVQEMDVTIPTYPFSDPDPIPILASQAELYPYHKFSTYSESAEDKSWRVVILENKYLKVEILPEVGGKIWGITEKKTGYDIIYKNESLKFRNIATRGPWTSGGIEFNFGFFGHTPYAATPVSYSAYTTSEGDAVCVLGASDLPSRSDWRVKVILPANNAWVKIEFAWINTTPYNHPYYYWTNAAIKATQDLKFNYPGNMQIGHGGEANPYPVDNEGRNLSIYTNNAFGENKSYHVVGGNKPFKAVYWTDRGIGIGSLADKIDITGKKLWIWSMAPSGAVWEQLLTDKNGQYVELQSGRLYNQASIESGINTPYTQYQLTPYQCEYWSEYWYPVIGTGGVSEASKEGVLHVDRKNADTLKINLMALEPLNTRLTVVSNKTIIYDKKISLEPIELIQIEAPLSQTEQFEIFVAETDLHHSSDNPFALTNRPLQRQHPINTNISNQDIIIAEENFKYRRFNVAEEHYHAYIGHNPESLKSLARLAEICMRTNRPSEAYNFLVRALEIDTYNGYANFLFGVLNFEIKDYNTAEEAFAISSRDMAWKISSYIETAKIHLLKKNYKRCIYMCRQALQYDSGNINTLKLLALAYRASSLKEQYENVLRDIKNIDYLNNFTEIEKWLRNRSEGTELPKHITHNEFPDQLLLELAIYYYKSGFNDDAISLLKTNKDNPIFLYWMAHVDKDNAGQYLQLANTPDITYTFPHHDETYKVLESATTLSSSWKIKYYMALLQWKWGDKEKAADLFGLCENVESSVFYLIRGVFYESTGLKTKAESDFRTAYAMKHSDWRVCYHLIKILKGDKNLKETLSIAREGVKTYKNQFGLQYEYANILIITSRYKEALNVLQNMVVLPAEHTGSAYPLYFSANILQGLEEIIAGNLTKAIIYFEASKKWPSNLGGGFGYEPDFTLQNLMINHCNNGNPQQEMDNFIATLEKKVTDKTFHNWISCYRNNDKNGMLDCIKLFEKRITDYHVIPNEFILLKSIQLLLN